MAASRTSSPSGSGEPDIAEPMRADGDGAPVRIVDLADELDLSIATVSRALNNSAAVRPEVAERVRSLAVRRGYVANRLARSLRSHTRSFIGFLVPDVENLAYSIAADACATYVARSGHQLILAISGDDAGLELQALRSLAEAQVGGLIVAPSPDMSAESRRLLRGLSVVEFNRTAGLSEDMVLCDDRAAFVEATRHLLDLGHQSLAYIGTTDAVSNGRERLEGVRAELRRDGKRLLKRRTRLLPPTERDGYRAAHELLSGPDRPTAMLVGSSNLSMGVAHAVRDLGITVPDDMSLIVYGDSRWGQLYSPALTTVTAPYAAMARSVADIVSGLVSHDDERPAGAVRLPAELVVRASTAPPKQAAAPQNRST
ncbi:MAG TPA: LacI family DNA-binding transcriptional regulator [Nocardioidaceae bacterium]|nr:LacI family DNA-binding transcriptional regulator [Nocardioidaceae bacterium]